MTAYTTRNCKYCKQPFLPSPNTWDYCSEDCKTLYSARENKFIQLEFAKEFVKKHKCWPDVYRNYAIDQLCCYYCSGHGYAKATLHHDTDCVLDQFQQWESWTFTRE